MRVALAGAGRVGSAVATLLVEAGHDLVAVASRTSTSAERAATRLRATVTTLDEIANEAEVVLIGASDPAIEEVAARLAPHAQGRVFWHFAGSLGVAPLSKVIGNAGRAVAGHPVQACPDVDTGIRRIPGSAWGVTASDPELGGWAASLISGTLRGTPVSVTEEVRPLWHAAAVTTSNSIAAVLALGEALLEGIGIEDGASVLGPLAAGTVSNAIEGGGGGATLTGPVVRGEAVTIERHIAALRETVPELLDAYLQACRLVFDSAQRAGRLDPEASKRMRRLLGDA